MSMSISAVPRRLVRCVAISCLLVLGACAKKEEKPPPPPPPEVGFVTVQPRAVALTTDLPGRTVAFRVADVRPQVSGVILKRLFVEGSTVKAGQPLYQIDPATFRANLASAVAAQAKAEASVVSSRLLAQRYKPLADAQAVSRQDYDNAVASQAQAEADVASAKASVETARINLVYTRVLSPISGRTGRSSVTEGALVASGQTTALVTVQQLDPIYVDVVQPSTMLLRLQRELKSGALQKASDSQAQVKLALEDGTAYEQPGKLKFAEVTVDQGTGSVTLRAEYPNPSGILLPGMFVHQRIEEGVNAQALLLPQQGVSHNARGEPTVLLVGDDGKAQQRTIKTDRAIGDQWLVSDGIKAGDKVIVQGLQSAKPNAAVRAREISEADLNKPPASPGAGSAPGGAASAPAATQSSNPSR